MNTNIKKIEQPLLSGNRNLIKENINSHQISEILLSLYIISMVLALPFMRLNDMTNYFGLSIAPIVLWELLIKESITSFYASVFKYLVPLGLLVFFHFAYIPQVGMGGLGFTIGFFQQIGLFLLLFLFISKTGRTNKFMAAFSLASAAILILNYDVIINLKNTWNEAERLWIGGDGMTKDVGLNPNSLGVILNATVLLVIKYFLIDRVNLKTGFSKIVLDLIAVTGLAVCSFMIAYALGSRQHHLWLAITILGSPFMLYKRSYGKAFFMLVPFIWCICALGFGFLIRNSPHFERLQNLFDLLSGENVGGESFDARMVYILRGVDLWAESPIFGSGLGAFTRFSGFGTYSHNQYIELLCSFGVLGIGFFYFLHCHAVYTAVKTFRKRFVNASRASIWILICIFGILFHNLTKPTLYEKPMWVLLGILFGYVQVVRLKGKLLTRAYKK